jgi:DNA-directed RNA polymerase subunit RPC12/RpoP
LSANQKGPAGVLGTRFILAGAAISANITDHFIGCPWQEDTDMSHPIYYIQECPTCGRNLRVRVVYLGKRVVCKHCSSEFLAFDPSSGDTLCGSSILERADQLLASVHEMKNRPR